LLTYRGTDGETWIQMVDRTFPKLASDLYVGMFYSPEFANNPSTDSYPGGNTYPEGIGQELGHGVLAEYRNYSITTAGAPPGGGGKFTSIKVQGGNVVIEFTGTGVQSANTVLGPWTDVTGSSPLTVPVTGGPKFYRFKP